jgi:hypothetical protein
MRKTATQLLSTGVLDGYEVQAWITSAKVEELEDLIRVAAEFNAPSFVIEDAQTALQIHFAKAALKPHWSVTPGFWIAVVSTLTGIVGIGIGWLAFRHDVQEPKPAPVNHPDKSERLSTSSTNLPHTQLPK